MQNCNETERQEILDKFESAVEGSGEAIQDQNDFEMAETDWSPEDKKAFCGVLVPEYL